MPFSSFSSQHNSLLSQCQKMVAPSLTISSMCKTGGRGHSRSLEVHRLNLEIVWGLASMIDKNNFLKSNLLTYLPPYYSLSIPRSS